MPNDTYNDITVKDIERELYSSMSDDLCFITITLKPRLYKFLSTTQYEMTVNEIEHIYKTMTEKTVYSTELTVDGNIHYHSITKFRDKCFRINFINKMKKNRLFGYIKITDAPIKYADQLERSAQYLLKDVLATERILHTRNYKPGIVKIL